MQFRIVHTTGYRYSRPVFLEPHEVRLQPRSSGAQSVLAFDLQIKPAPAGMSHAVDAEGNGFASIWFDGLHEEVVVTARSTVECRRENPFDYLLRPQKTILPLSYDGPVDQLLQLGRSDSEVSEAVRQFAARFSEKASGHLQPFLDQLNQGIYTEFKCVRRDEGDPWLAQETLARREGSCRDFAVLFMDACRSQGVAARFVSGYQEGDPDQENRDLHAWVEVYVPGAGWRGYDPTHGLLVSDRHVAVAASVFPAQTAPLVGTFRGTGAAAKMESEIELEVVLAEPQIAQIQQQQQG